MKYRLDEFCGKYYAIPIDAWSEWESWKQSESDLYGAQLPKYAWEFETLGQIVFQHPEFIN